MNKTVQILSKFPCDLIEIVSRDYNQKKYSRNDVINCNPIFDRLYMTTEGDLIIVQKLRFDKGCILNLKNLKREPTIMKFITYKRNSHDYKNEPFIHHFNGSERIYTCKYLKNVVIYITGYKDLWKKEVEN